MAQLCPTRRTLRIFDLEDQVASGSGTVAHPACGGAAIDDALTDNSTVAETIAARCRPQVPEGALGWPAIRPNCKTGGFSDTDSRAAIALRRVTGIRTHHPEDFAIDRDGLQAFLREMREMNADMRSKPLIALIERFNRATS